MGNKKFWQFRAKKDTGADEGELLLYGEISSSTWWGDEVTPKQFKQDLDALGDIGTLNIYINSGGGDVFAGQAIHSILKRHKAKKKVYVDGLAASIASVIAMAGDTVYMPKNATLMIHNPWTIAIGNASDFRKLAEDLDIISEGIIATYEGKSGLPRDEIIELMNAETWMSAEEAVKLGFADEIEETKQIAASITNGQMLINGQTIDLSRFRNPPKQAFGTPAIAIVAIEHQSNAFSGGVQNEGRTLSSSNEERIRQANTLLGEVLDQLIENGAHGKTDSAITPLESTKPEENRPRPIDIYTAQIQINRRRLAHV